MMTVVISILVILAVGTVISFTSSGATHRRDVEDFRKAAKRGAEKVPVITGADLSRATIKHHRERLDKIRSIRPKPVVKARKQPVAKAESSTSDAEEKKESKKGSDPWGSGFL